MSPSGTPPTRETYPPVRSLLRPKMTALPESKVRKHPNRFLLLFQLRLHEILNRNNPDYRTVLFEQGKVTNIFHQHFGHAGRDGLIGRSGDEVGALCGDFFHFHFFGGFAEKGDFADVVALADDSGDVS